jgi:Gas vesicle protein G
VNLVTLPFRLPLLPVRGLIKLAEIIRDEAEQEYHDPSAVRHELEEAAWSAEAGHMSDEEVARREDEAVSRLVQPEAPAAEAAARSGEEG